MNEIKFGTDGWRAIIAKDFTVNSLTRVAEASAKWLIQSTPRNKKTNGKNNSVVVGYDCRFGGELFADTVAKVFASSGIKVFLSKGFVSTPMVSLGTVKKKADLGIIITASHNPPSYNGFKLKGAYGGPLLPEKVQEIENLIEDKHHTEIDKLSINEFLQKELIEYVDLETMYCDHVKAHFDLPSIHKSGLRLAYDAMFGAGQQVIKRLLPDTELLHCEFNPSFNGQAPEPINKNLQEFSKLIKSSGSFDCGLATDGDADRLGLFDSEGNFIDSHHIILLLINYLFAKKGMKGKVVTAFSVSPKISRMCKHFGLEHEETKIGFKYIAGKMVDNDVLLGGEESGGIAIKGHIPERDGIWIGLTILEYMAKSGKSLRELIDEVYAIVGPFAFERSDLFLKEDVKNKIVKNCENNVYKSFGEYKIQRIETTDGYKYFFNENEWLMIRASGTEPVLRNYAESYSYKNAFSILKAAELTLLSPPA